MPSEEYVPNQKQPLIDLMKVGVIPSNTDMDVETIIARPVVNTNTFARWVLEPRGMLSSQSRIQFSYTGTADKHAFCPRNVGILSLIKRAVLRGNDGATILQEIDDFNHFSAFESEFLDGEHQVEKEQFTSNRCISHQVLYDDTLTNVDTSNTQGDGIGLDNGIEMENQGDLLRMPESQYLRNNPIFSVSLGDLFPIIRNNQLPTYAMKSLVVELTFEPSGTTATTRGRNCIRVGDTANLDYPLNTAETKMFCDYIHYSEGELKAWEGSDALKNGKKVISYVDYRLTKTSMTHTQAQDQIRNLGGANRQVNKIIVGICNDHDSETSIINKYNAQWVGSAQSVTINVKYNDRYLFSGGDVDNNARHYNNIVRAEALAPHITKEEFCNEVLSLSTKDMEGWAYNTYLAGKFGWLSLALNRGEKVNQRGVELYSKYVSLADLGGALTYTQRAWIEVVRIAEIDVTGGTGHTNVYWA
jgi:hypothetical protein